MTVNSITRCYLPGGLVLRIPKGKVLRTRIFWLQLKGRTQNHDSVVATISHLPHVIAFAVMNAVASSHPRALEFAGSGFRDFTRIAASHPEMWRDIVLANRERILSALDATASELQNLRNVIERQDARWLVEAFTRARDARRSLDLRGPRGPKARGGPAARGKTARKRKR